MRLLIPDYSHKRLNNRKHRRKKNPRRSYIKNGIDLELNKNDCEVMAHVVVEGEKCVKLWGQVKDSEGNPVKAALIKLLKPVSKEDGDIEFVGIDHTITDSLGFYKFNLSPDNQNTKLIVIASKATSGNERTISENNNLCNPCK